MNIHAHGEILRRRDEILRIIGQQSVHSQDELLAVLRKHGVRVTQPTLSRDLRELGVAKSPNGYVAPGDLAAVTPIATFTPRELRRERLEQLVRDNVLSAEAAGNMVVIKTPAAAAQPVASAMDTADLDDDLGTVGGDDTIFVAHRTPPAAASFARRLQNIAGILPARRHAR
jgi:transcriptional regulator of arginine metabolism